MTFAALFRPSGSKLTSTACSPTASPVDGPIQTIHLPGNDRVMALEEGLRERGYLVKGIRSPSVPEGEERLRICLHAYNSKTEVQGLVETIGPLLQKLGK